MSTKGRLSNEKKARIYKYKNMRAIRSKGLCEIIKEVNIIIESNKVEKNRRR